MSIYGAYLGYVLGMSWAYLWHIMSISLAYLKYVLGISWEYFWRILGISLPYYWIVGEKRPLNGVRNTNTCSVRQNAPKNLPFFCSSILHPWLAKVFKSKTTSFHYFPQGFQIFKIFGHPTLGSGDKKTFNRYLKSEQTNRQTDKHTDGQIDL